MLRAAMLRLAGGIFSAAMGAFAWLIVGMGMAERTYVETGGVIDGAAVRAAMAREGEVATRLGMRLAAQGEARVEEHGSRGAWSMPLPFAANECVAVVVGVEGRHRVAQLAIQGGARVDEVSAEAMAQGSTGGGLVAHVQWCERGAVPRNVVALSDRVASMSQRNDATLRWAVYRGSWDAVGGPTRLTRGRFRSEALAALGDDLAAREAAPLLPQDAQPLAAPIYLAMGAARLLPSDGRTYAALVRASQRNDNPRVNPRIDATVAPGAPWPTGLPLDFGGARMAAGADPALAVHDAVVDLGRNDFRRVLAVVDRARLGVPCARIALVRNRFAHGARVTAMDETGARRAIEARENVAIDAACPAGVTLYLAPASDHDLWTLHVYP